MAGRVFLIGDSRRGFSGIRTYIECWPGVQLVEIIGEAQALFERCRQTLDSPEGLPAGEPREPGAVLLDLNWGRDAETMGCDFVYWLRLADRRQRVIISSQYLREADGTLLEPAASRLPKELGWLPPTEEHLTEWPSPLTEEEAKRARAAAARLSKPQQSYWLDAIWAKAKPAAYGQAVNWQQVAALVALLQATDEGDRAAEAEQLQAIADAIERADVVGLKEAVNAYERSAVGTEE